MGFYDRQYSQDPQKSPWWAFIQNLFPSVTPVVRWLLLVNIAIFCFSLIPFVNYLFLKYLSVFPISTWNVFQIWRPITYQFLHANLGHIFFNMLGLFFFGPMVERVWGSRRFVFFYLVCGAAGGILYTLLVIFRVLGAGSLIGASGAIYGVTIAAAILYPRQTVIFIFVPMPMFALAILYVILSLSGFSRGQNAGGEAAHLAGMAVGALYVAGRPWLDRFRVKKAEGNWQKHLDEESRLRKEVDRILDKVHASGIQSLNWREKRTLKKATAREQQEIRDRK